MANFTGNQIRHTYQRVVQIHPESTGQRGMLQDGFGRPLSASIMALSVSQSLNVTGKAAITGSVNVGRNINVQGDGVILGDLTIGGTVTAQDFITEYVSSSIIYESGSTTFGDTPDDLHIRTGSLLLEGSSTIEGTQEVKKGVIGAFFGNPQVINIDTEIPTHYNSRLFGPITIAAGKVLTVGANAKLEITDI